MPHGIEEIERLRKRAFDAYSEDRMAAAVELLRCYLKYFPDDDKAWFTYGDALRVIGLRGAAAVALSNAEKMCPHGARWGVHMRLGLLFHDKGDYTSAERWYAKAFESDETSNSSWAWVMRGANFAASEFFDEAEKCHRKAIASNANDDEAYLNLGYVLRAKRQYEAAKSAAQMALRVTPDYQEAIELLRSLENAQESQELTNELASPSQN